jgi:hypothetical protein
MRTRDWAVVDFYAELGVEPTASTDDIATAFRTLAKRFHPDRHEAGSAASERFTAVVAAYEVVGDARLRRAYDEVRIAALPVARPQGAVGVTPGPSSGERVAAATVDPRIARRNARRWLVAGVAVLVAGVVMATLVVRLQAHDHARRAGRVKIEAVIVASPTATAHNDVRFSTGAGRVVQVPEPTRVNPGTDSIGQRLAVLYRPADPRDVIVDESTAARDITLWIVAVKPLVGGAVFLGVGLRGRRRVGLAKPR